MDIKSVRDQQFSNLVPLAADEVEIAWNKKRERLKKSTIRKHVQTIANYGFQTGMTNDDAQLAEDMSDAIFKALRRLTG